METERTVGKRKANVGEFFLFRAMPKGTGRILGGNIKGGVIRND